MFHVFDLLKVCFNLIWILHLNSVVFILMMCSDLQLADLLYVIRVADIYIYIYDVFVDYLVFVLCSQYRNAILYLVERYQTVIIIGETGCGKSTQIPQASLTADPLICWLENCMFLARRHLLFGSHCMCIEGCTLFTAHRSTKTGLMCALERTMLHISLPDFWSCLL